MTNRTIKKILRRKTHPKHQSVRDGIQRRIEAIYRAECMRLDLDPDKWQVYTLRIPPLAKRFLRMVG